MFTRMNTPLMLNRFCTMLLLAVAAGCHSSGKVAQSPTSANTLTAQEKKLGWQLLFDGSTRNGWHIFNNKTDGSAWKVADGALYLDPAAKGPKGEGGGELISDQEFSNFDLKLEWKLAPNGNSGIMFLCQEDPKYKYAYVTGPEMQIIDNNGHPDAKNVKHRAADLYDLVSAVPENVRPIGEWNQVEIILINGKLSLFQNGARVVSTTLWDDNWKAMVARSKFRNMPDFAAFKKGRITLQDHGDKVWFRNIRIKNL